MIIGNKDKQYNQEEQLSPEYMGEISQYAPNRFTFTECTIPVEVIVKKEGKSREIGEKEDSGKWGGGCTSPD